MLSPNFRIEHEGYCIPLSVPGLFVNRREITELVPLPANLHASGHSLLTGRVLNGFSLVIAGCEVINDDDEYKASNGTAKKILEVTLSNNLQAQEVAIRFLKKINEHMSQPHLFHQIRLLDRVAVQLLTYVTIGLSQHWDGMGCTWRLIHRFQTRG